MLFLPLVLATLKQEDDEEPLTMVGVWSLWCSINYGKRLEYPLSKNFFFFSKKTLLGQKARESTIKIIFLKKPN
jgi:hypothetical protein